MKQKTFFITFNRLSLKQIKSTFLEDGNRTLTLVWLYMCITPSPPPPPSCWFSLNNSETVKAVTLAFWNIQYHFIRNVRAKFGIPYSPQSSDIGQNSDRGIFDFRISGQSLIQRNCHNSRTSDDVDMKLGSVTKRNKKNKTTSKIFGDDVMSENCDVIAIFLICSQFGAIPKPDSGRIVCKTYIFINSNFYLTKTENRTKKSLNSSHTIALSKGTILAKKC